MISTCMLRFCFFLKSTGFVKGGLVCILLFVNILIFLLCIFGISLSFSLQLTLTVSLVVLDWYVVPCESYTFLGSTSLVLLFCMVLNITKLPMILGPCLFGGCCRSLVLCFRNFLSLECLWKVLGFLLLFLQLFIHLILC